MNAEVALEQLDAEIRSLRCRLASLVERREMLAGATERVTGEDPTVGFARRILALRRLRETMFGPDYATGPAWDMLLDLYIQTRRRVPVSVSQLCLAAGAPNTTALRWINGMVASGLLVRRADPTDGRRVFVHFAPGAEESMEVFLARAMAELKVPL